MLFPHCDLGGGGPQLRFWSSGLGSHHVLMHCKTLLSGLGGSLGGKNKIKKTNNKPFQISGSLTDTGSSRVYVSLQVVPFVSEAFFSVPLFLPLPSILLFFSCVLKYCKSSQVSDVFLTMSLWKLIFKKIMSVEKTYIQVPSPFYLGGIH